MDVTLDDLIQKCNISFDKIKGSTKRAEVLETLARRAGVEADVVTVAIWETQWDEKFKDEDKEKKASAAPRGAAPKAADVSFTDPVKGSVLSFSQRPPGEKGMSYAVNGEPRPPFTRIVISTHAKGPHLKFPELRTAATVPWECSESVLKALARMADASGVQHNIPANGKLSQQDDTRGIRSRPPVSYVETDGAMASLPPGTVMQLVSATFGDGYRQVSCAPSITARLDRGGLAAFLVSAENLGVVDPAPGGPKKLEITYIPAHATSSPVLVSNSPYSGAVHMNGGMQVPMQRYGSHANDSPVANLMHRSAARDDDAQTEGSHAYTHDPYQTMSQITDDRSDATSLTNSTMRNSEITPEDMARYAVPQNRPGRAYVQANEGETLVVPSGTMARVVRAVYGHGERWVLATQAAKRAFSNGGIPGLLVSEESLGVVDPWPGQQKTLVVTYRPLEERDASANNNVQSPRPSHS